MADDNLGYAGFQSPGFGSDGWGAVAFIAREIMNRICTTTLCQVVKVTNAGELSQAGFIDVQPLVNQITPDGKPIPHGVIYNVPYMRIQGGSNAIIIDPVVGDIGFVGFASHDISGVIAARGQANPASFRRYDLADAVWVGGVLNGTPTQYIQFNADGIKMHSPHKITLDAAEEIDLVAPVIKLNASTSITATTPTFTINGDLSVSQTVTATIDVVGNGTSLHSHTHNMPLIQSGGTTKPTSSPL